MFLNKTRKKLRFHGLIQELQLYHGAFAHISGCRWDSLSSRWLPHLRKQRHKFRDLIDLEKRLAVCLK